MTSLLLFPFLACVILVLVHVYFGAFVLKRGILFIDLALAQWAALGYVVAHLLGITEALPLFLTGFGFTIIASMILTGLKPLYNKINLQEAVIGVMYIGAATIAIGIISSTGMEEHHLKDMLTGHLLFTQASDLIPAAILYSIIGIILATCHSRFTQSKSPLWDLIFYILFGCVVTSSVKIAGILLVFSYLVLPVLSTVLLTQKLHSQMIAGWIIGITSSVIGLGLSLVLDIPPSYCIILTLCTGWILSILIYYSKQKLR
jgi:zinc/manganese transport system permease protein